MHDRCDADGKSSVQGGKNQLTIVPFANPSCDDLPGGDTLNRRQIAPR